MASRKLEKLQERAFKAVFNKKINVTCEELINLAKVNTLLNQRLQDIAILMFRVKHDLCPEYIQVLFHENYGSCNLRYSDLMIRRYNSVKCGKHSQRYAGSFLWSKLMNDIKNAISLSAFKNKIRKTNLETFAGDDNCKNCPLCMG